MITISLCMIVKNEEKVLGRCLDSVADLVDELIIADTGSTDRTKAIAEKYGAVIYDFPWIDDFSAARNFVFSKATKEYIYTADADEVLDEANREAFRLLKSTLLPDIEIVQMKYRNQLQFQTVYNFDEELRPKLFKRLREFCWEAPIHETVRLTPIVYDSDIAIDHLPEASHAGRDLDSFYRQCSKGYRLTSRLHNMYARELLLAGEKEDFVKATPFFEESAGDVERSPEEVTEACLVLAHGARLQKDAVSLLKYTAKVLAGEGNSECCCELGWFYEEQKDYEEAAIWFYNAAFETSPVLNIRSANREPLEGLIRCYEAMNCPEQAEIYRRELAARQEGVR